MFDFRQYYEMSYGLNVEMHKQVRTSLVFNDEIDDWAWAWLPARHGRGLEPRWQRGAVRLKKSGRSEKKGGEQMISMLYTTSSGTEKL